MCTGKLRPARTDRGRPLGPAHPPEGPGGRPRSVRHSVQRRIPDGVMAIRCGVGLPGAGVGPRSSVGETGPMSPLTVRPRRPEDLPRLVELLAEQQPSSGYPHRWPLPFPAERFLSRPGELTAWVAERDGEPLGHACVQRVDQDPEPGSPAALALPHWLRAHGRPAAQLGLLSALFVSLAARGTGAGGLLLDTATSWIGGAGLAACLDVIPMPGRRPWRSTAGAAGARSADCAPTGWPRTVRRCWPWCGEGPDSGEQLDPVAVPVEGVAAPVAREGVALGVRRPRSPSRARRAATASRAAGSSTRAGWALRAGANGSSTPTWSSASPRRRVEARNQAPPRARRPRAWPPRACPGPRRRSARATSSPPGGQATWTWWSLIGRPRHLRDHEDPAERQHHAAAVALGVGRAQPALELRLEGRSQVVGQRLQGRPRAGAGDPGEDRVGPA